MKSIGMKLPPGRRTALVAVTERIRREMADEMRETRVRRHPPKKQPQSRRIDGRGVVVTCIETGDVYASLTLAADAMNTRSTEIARSVATGQAIHGKHFRRANEAERDRVKRFHGGSAFERTT